MTIDIAMVVILPLLMAYSLIGELFHEVVGTLMFALFIAHHAMNRHLPKKTLPAVIDGLLLIFMIAQPVSGILMSKHLYTFISIPGAAVYARQIHMVLAYWGFALLCVHAGTHLVSPIRRLRKRGGKTGPLVCGALALISLYGCIAFVKRQLPLYMFGQVPFALFDFSEPKIFFFLDYLAMMILFAMVGALIAMLISGRKVADGKGNEPKA
ncbi:MAG: DUF4405 domain-containing protein [Bacillota bacterium]|nr:DUF4405 domain-containing protein [Bacillota bacterium]